MAVVDDEIPKHKAEPKAEPKADPKKRRRPKRNLLGHDADQPTPQELQIAAALAAAGIYPKSRAKSYADDPQGWGRGAGYYYQSGESGDFLFLGASVERAISFISMGHTLPPTPNNLRIARSRRL